MSLRVRNGRWAWRFILDGKQHSQGTGLAATERNRTDAERMEWEYRTAILEGRMPPRRIKARLFSDAAEEFLEWTETAYRDHPNTAKRLAVSFVSLKKLLGPRMVMAIDAGAVEEYLDWRRKEHEVQEVTLRHDYFALSSFFGWARRKRYAVDNPVRQVKAPSDLNAIRIHVLSPEEEKVYFALALAHKNLYDVARLMLNQGCRPGEILALKKSDVDLMGGKLHIREGKTKAARRTLKLTAEALLILAGRMKQDEPRTSEWVFPSQRKGKRLLSVQNQHYRVLEKLQAKGTPVKFVLYDLRHTYASRMAALNCPLATLGQILGHAPGSIRVITRYVHPTQSEMDSFTSKYEASMTKEKANA